MTELAPENELIVSLNIGHLLAQRDAALGKFNHAVELLREAAAIAESAHLKVPRIEVHKPGWSSNGDVASPEHYQRMLDTSGWEYLMKASGNLTFMDQAARSEWDRGLESKEMPELTLENIRATFTNLRADRGEMFNRGVVNVFRKLSWRYKTNSPVMFGKRIILSRVLSTYSGKVGRYASTNYNTCDSLNDLVRVFSILDGKPEPDHRTGVDSVLSPLLRQGPYAWPLQVEFEYFSLRMFQNGNGHLCFTRPDLVKQMNRILAAQHPNAIPADREAA